MDNIFNNNYFYSKRCCQNFSVKGQINILGIGDHCVSVAYYCYFVLNNPLEM